VRSRLLNVINEAPSQKFSPVSDTVHVFRNWPGRLKRSDQALPSQRPHLRHQRRPDEPGSAFDERAVVFRYHMSHQYFPSGNKIDVTGTVPSVVDTILGQLD